jgi:RNA polymerase sigma-70 factor, ECF subfamily
VLVALPPEQREVLWLGYFEGLSSSEMAERVGVPIGTVKSRVAAALAALRSALSDSMAVRR